MRARRPHAPALGELHAPGGARVLSVPFLPPTGRRFFRKVRPSSAARASASPSLQSACGDFRHELVAFMYPQLDKKISFRKLTYDNNVSKVSIIGVGMITTPGITYRMFQALASKKINIMVISTSEIKISVLISNKRDEYWPRDQRPDYS